MENNHLREPDVHINDSFLLDDKELDNVDLYLPRYKKSCLPRIIIKKISSPSLNFNKLILMRLIKKMIHSFPNFKIPTLLRTL